MFHLSVNIMLPQSDDLAIRFESIRYELITLCERPGWLIYSMINPLCTKGPFSRQLIRKGKMKLSSFLHTLYKHLCVAVLATCCGTLNNKHSI